jgi:hypothetical protein
MMVGTMSFTMNLTVWGNFEHETEVKRDFINAYVSFMAVYCKTESRIGY